MMRSVLGRLIRVFKNTSNAYKLQIRNYQRSITGDRVRELNKTTLTGRLLASLNGESTAKDEISLDILECSYEDSVTKLKQSNVGQVVLSIRSLGFSPNDHEREKYLKLLNALDDECSERLKQLDAQEILDILHAFMQVIPNRIVQYRYYNCAVIELVNRLDVLGKKELIQLIFYLGLKKKMAGYNLLRRCINLLDEKSIEALTAEELCVICNATFKSGTKIDNEAFLDRVVSYIRDNLHLLQDTLLLISMLKTIRHNRYQTEDLLATLSCGIFFNKTLDYYPFVAMCHILAVYADFLYYDENVLKAFTERCVFLLKNCTLIPTHEIPRIKDIKRLLWCLSNLNCTDLEVAEIETVIVPNIVSRMEAGELKDDPSSLVEIVLYLWMLNYRAYELMPNTLTDRNISSIKASASPMRHRLNLLLSCIFYEDRGLFREFNVHPDSTTDYDPKYQMEKRPILQRIAENLKQLGSGQEINRYEVGCQIPGLNIVGITGYRKNIYKAVHIEVLDDYTSLKNTESKPSGLMQLKLRLLNGLEEGVVVIESDDVESMSDEELQKFLLAEIELVC